MLYGIGDVSGGGGAERFWADFFEKYRTYDQRKYDVYLFCDGDSYGRLKEIRRLSGVSGVVFLKNYSNRFKHTLEFFDFYLKLLSYGINVVHVAEYTTVYYERLRKLSRLPGWMRPVLSTTLVNCIIPYRYDWDAGFKKPIDQVLKAIRFDGIMSWYHLLKEFILEKGFAYKVPYVYAVSYCFADTSKFRPAEKRNDIVFAARLGANKNPLMFVEAVSLLERLEPERIKDWSFAIYGKGEQEELVRERIRELGLQHTIKMGYSLHMADVLAHSKCFVSTQDYENFTSLSMLEAMACGNVIVSRNVGQTGYFAKAAVNAFLAEEDTAKGIAMALAEFINRPELHERMQMESVRIATEIHTAKNFFKETEEYWEALLARK
ncbi:MAG: glycosyltransferase [Bacteroidota bacterium]